MTRILLAPGDVELPLEEKAEIARVVPPLGVNRAGRGLGVLVVRPELERAPERDLADGALGQRPTPLVDDRDLAARDRAAARDNRRALRPLGRAPDDAARQRLGVGVADVDGGAGAARAGHGEGVLGHPVADPERLPPEPVPAEALVERLVALRADGLGAVHEPAQRAEVHPLNLGVLHPAGEQVVGEVRLPRERPQVVPDEPAGSSPAR